MSNTTDATVDALTARGHGAIENGRLKHSVKKQSKKKEQRNGVVEQARAPIEPWKCDSCRSRGSNFAELKAHVEKTGHLSATRIE